MMKRLTAVLLALLMMCQCAFAAEEADSLTEKISLQMGDGSGMKGSFSLKAEGDAEWAKTIAATADNDYQIRCIKSGDGYLLEVYAAEGEDKQALTRIYITDEGTFLSSVLLPDTELLLPAGTGMLDMMTGAGSPNPSWYGAALNMAGIEDDVWNTQWQDALAPYFTNIEVWMTSYGAAPVVTEEDGQTVMILRYEIPAKAIPDMMVSLLSSMLKDQTLMTLLTGQMTPEQQAVYLAPELLYHYENIIRSLPWEGSIIIERKMTPMGDVLYSSMTFPLMPGEHGWKTVRIEEALGACAFTLTGDEGELSLDITAPEAVDGGDKRIVTYHSVPAVPSEENKAVSWRATVVSKYETHTDDDTRGHEMTTFDVTVEEDLSHLAADAPERAFYEKVETKRLTFTLHLHSKNANTSPTTAALDFTYTEGGSSVTFSGQIKTTSPWLPGAYKSDAPKAIIDMTEEEVSGLVSMFTINAVEALDGK